MLNKFAEIAMAKNRCISQNEKMLSVLVKTLENVAAERVNKTAPYNDEEIYAELTEIKATTSAIVEGVSDEAAVLAPDMFPTMKNNNELIKAGTRINWNGKVKRASVDVWDRTENNPDASPLLWEDINQIGEYREIPDIITAGLAFANNEFGWWHGVLYKSLIDNNVWTPDEYPTAWEKAG